MFLRRTDKVKRRLTLQRAKTSITKDIPQQTATILLPSCNFRNTKKKKKKKLPSSNTLNFRQVLKLSARETKSLSISLFHVFRIRSGKVVAEKYAADFPHVGRQSCSRLGTAETALQRAKFYSKNISQLQS